MANLYTKLFAKILDSSIWLENDSTRVVWITLLASMDADGFCAFASVENLSRRAHVKPSLTAKALAVLEAPDPKSSDDGFEGRRLERVQGGWIVLNAKKYRDITRSGELRPSRRKSEQLGATGSNSAQLGTPIEVSTNEINKSVPDQNKIRIRSEKNKDIGASAFELPPELLHYAQDWKDFEEMRKKIRKPMTDRARKLICATLVEFQSSGHDPGSILQKSIKNSWQDVYEPKGESNGSNKPDIFEQIRRAREASYVGGQNDKPDQGRLA